MIRKRAKGQREVCFICGKHKSITQQHHVNPFKNIKTHVKYHGHYKSKLIWLCPNCHIYVHKTIYKWNTKEEEWVATNNFFDSVGKQNEHKIFELLKEFEKTKWGW